MTRRMDQKGKKRPWAKTIVWNGKSNVNRLSLCDYYRELGVEPEYCKKAKKKKGRISKGKIRKLPIIKIVPQINEQNEIGGIDVDNSDANIPLYRFHGKLFINY